MIWLEKRGRTIERNDKSELEQKLPTPASRDNAIKTDVVVVADYPETKKMCKHAINKLPFGMRYVLDWYKT